MILDQTRLDGIRATVHIGGGPFLGYAVGTDDLANPLVALRGNDTQIQSTAVNHDFGVIDDPDSFHRAHPRNEHRLKGLLRLVARAGTLAYCFRDARRPHGHARESDPPSTPTTGPMIFNPL